METSLMPLIVLLSLSISSKELFASIPTIPTPSSNLVPSLSPFLPIPIPSFPFPFLPPSLPLPSFSLGYSDFLGLSLFLSHPSPSFLPHPSLSVPFDASVSFPFPLSLSSLLLHVSSLQVQEASFFFVHLHWGTGPLAGLLSSEASLFISSPSCLPLRGIVFSSSFIDFGKGTGYFLDQFDRDDEAEENYLKSLFADPAHSNCLCLYADFLTWKRAVCILFFFFTRVLNAKLTNLGCGNLERIAI